MKLLNAYELVLLSNVLSNEGLLFRNKSNLKTLQYLIFLIVLLLCKKAKGKRLMRKIGVTYGKIEVASPNDNYNYNI